MLVEWKAFIKYTEYTVQHLLVTSCIKTRASLGISDKIAVVAIAIDETKIFLIDYSDDSPTAIPI